MSRNHNRNTLLQLIELSCDTSTCLAMATIHVTPEEALMDQKLSIQLTGLKPREVITFFARTNEKGKRFASFAVYMANRRGQVNLSSDPSLHGTYTGVEPMGLFWSMKTEPGQRPFIRLMPRKADAPRVTLLYVFEGQLSWDELCLNHRVPLMETNIRRWYKKKNVSRIEMKEGRFRGIIFLPECKGPFPGVVDMFGGQVDLVEARAGLLASHGFAAFALAYLMLDETLPKSTEDADFKYVEDATRWFISQPFVLPGGIGVTGVCFGGSLALRLAAHIPEVKAVVSINGHTAHAYPILKYGNSEIVGCVLDSKKILTTEEGVVFRHSINRTESSAIPAWQHGAKILTLASGDDQCVNPAMHYWARDQAPKDKQKNMEIVFYPGAGHLIEPPYAPLFRMIPSTPVRYIGQSTAMGGFVFGGEPKQHALAQEDGWRRLLKFMHEHLDNKSEAISSRL